MIYTRHIPRCKCNAAKTSVCDLYSRKNSDRFLSKNIYFTLLLFFSN